MHASSAPLSVQEVTNTFQQASRDVNIHNVMADEDLRRLALGRARRLVACLERPEETVMYYAWKVRNIPSYPLQD